MAFHRAVGHGDTEIDALADLWNNIHFEMFHYDMVICPTIEIFSNQRADGSWIAVAQLVQPLDESEQPCYTENEPQSQEVE